MPKKAPFSLAQYEKLQAVTKKRSAKFKTQKEHALALGITQQSLSNLISGTYRPGVSVAEHVAELEGLDLEQLVGEYDRPTPTPPRVKGKKDRFPNLSACVAYHSADRTWPEWVIAAARGGYFGDDDPPSPVWFERLNDLERQLAKARQPAK